MHWQSVETGTLLCKERDVSASMNMEAQIILVNEKDVATGISEKLEVHRDGLLHRAFSIFIFNSRGELLLQRRAHNKYHSPGLWSNTCCGHPRPGEQLIVEARRRLNVEMGLDCQLEAFDSFIYRADVGDELVEHEFDHLIVGHSEDDPVLNPEEAMEWRRVPLAVLVSEVRECPEDFTCWLKIIIDTRLHKFPLPFG